MRTSLMSLGLLAVLAEAAPASAEESIRIPAYRDFVEYPAHRISLGVHP